MFWLTLFSVLWAARRKAWASGPNVAGFGAPLDGVLLRDLIDNPGDALHLPPGACHTRFGPDMPLSGGVSETMNRRAVSAP